MKLKHKIRSLIIKTPSFEALKEVSDRLKSAGIEFALGGSGLLAVLGIQEGDIHDWDITTEARFDEVEAALSGVDYELLGPGEKFATAYLFKIQIADTSIDLMGSFALKTDQGIESIKTIVTDNWKSIPVGCPVEWEKAYRLMGREKKASLLKGYLNHKK